MNVAIDSGPLESGHKVRGVGFYTQELIEAVKKQRIGLEKFNIDQFNFSTHQKSLFSDRYDIVHCSFFHPFFITIPRKVKAKLVITVHDLIHLIYPKNYPPGFRGRIKFTIQKQLLKKVDAIITVSETSKKDIVRFLKVDPNKIHVIHEASRPHYKVIKNRKILNKVRKQYELPKKFVLYVGDINYNKNIPSLVKACRNIETPLVLVGKQALDIKDQTQDLMSLKGPKDWIRFLFNKPHPELSHYKKVNEEVAGSNVLCLGFVPDDDLVSIYNLASVYCQPSFYEGFGLPVLEAMVCGTPVVISKTNALVEISQGSALVADPYSPKDFSGNIKMVVKDKKLSNELVEKGFKVASSYSWKMTAEKTLEVYRKVMKDGKK
jgi:glycosyltransferase involved in cell wall biosynthesis